MLRCLEVAILAQKPLHNPSQLPAKFEQVFFTHYILSAIESKVGYIDLNQLAYCRLNQFSFLEFGVCFMCKIIVLPLTN